MTKSDNIAEQLQKIADLCPSGYAIALHIRFTTPAFLFQTYDKDWMEHYSKKGLVLHDPTVRWGFANTGLCPWSELEAEDTHGVFEAARHHGLHHGFTLSLTDGGSRTVASFTRPDRPHSEDEVALIRDMLDSLHARTADPDSLPAAERDLLHELSVTLTHG